MRNLKKNANMQTFKYTTFSRSDIGSSTSAIAPMNYRTRLSQQSDARREKENR